MSQAYITNFSLSLAQELRSENIMVCVFNPFFISTNMTHNIKENLFIPNSKMFVANAMSSIKYYEDNNFVGYWLHSIVKYCFLLQKFISERFLNEKLTHFMNKAQKALRNNRKTIIFELFPSLNFKFQLQS